VLLVGFFNNPWMLGWLAAASAPIIIHLLSRRKHREMQWAAMQYLLAAIRKNSRRIRLEQWLLLAIRTMIILLLVMALAEPFLESAGVKLASGDRTHKVLVLDGSYSMAYKPSDKSRFDRAKELALRIVDESGQGDGFTLVVMGTPPRVVVGTPAFEARQVRDEIENLRLPNGGGDLAATLAKTEELLQAARKQFPRLVREEIYFLSDLGRTSWAPEARGRAVAADIRARGERLAKKASLYVLDLGQADGENVAVTQLSPGEPFATLGHAASFEAEVRNFGRQPRPHQIVELYVDGRRVAEQFVDLEPQGRATVELPYRFESIGSHAVELRVASDLLDLDNHRWVALDVKEHVRVLCIDGRPAAGGSGGATRYLSVALAPQTHELERNLVRVDVAGESALVETDLSGYDAIFLVDVGQFTANEAGVLHAYLERGGGLITFLGEQVQTENYDRRLGGQSTDGSHVLPAGLLARAPTGTYRFDPLDYQHPIMAAFRDQEQGGLITAPVSEYVKLHVEDGSSARVALAFDTGDPAIVEQTIGRGRSILVATSADVHWTALPVMGSYLPLVQELLAAAVRGQQAQRNVLVGQPLGDTLRLAANQNSIKIRTPAGESSVVRLKNEGDWSDWTFVDTQAAGVYQASLPVGPATEETFAVNLDTTESDLAKVDPAELREQVWSGVPFVLRNDWQDLTQESDESIVRRSGLHHVLLLAVAGLLFLETFVAYWFGKRAR
jgi:hypothetical protein